jgi:hypothetical protein
MPSRSQEIIGWPKGGVTSQRNVATRKGSAKMGEAAHKQNKATHGMTRDNKPRMNHLLVEEIGPDGGTPT